MKEKKNPVLRIHGALEIFVALLLPVSCRAARCLFPLDANRGPAADWAEGGREAEGREACSVTPQQAAVVLEPSACFNYWIISPPTLSLTSGENEERRTTLNILFFENATLDTHLASEVVYRQCILLGTHCNVAVSAGEETV